MVPGAENAGWLDDAEIVERLWVNDRDALAVADIKKALIGRKGEVARKNLIAFHQLLDELAVRIEHLNTAVLAVRDIDHAVLADADGMHNRELLRSRFLELLVADHRAAIGVHRLVAER